MAYAAVASSGNGLADRTPVYGKRAVRSKGSVSLKDLLLSETNAPVFELEYLPEACTVEADGEAIKASLLNKLNRAVKRLKAWRMVTGGVPKADITISHSRVKKLISSADLRNDISFLSVTPDDVLHAVTGGTNPVAALRMGSPGIIVWNLMQVILLAYVVVYVPFRKSFADVDDASCQKHPVFEGIDLFVDTFYLGDLLISACTQTVNEQGKLLSHLKDTVPHYIFSWTFVRDLVPAAPISWIEFVNNADDCNVVSTTSSVGLAKLLRILRIFRILRVLKLFNVKFVNEFLRHLDPNVKTLMGFFLSLVVLVHLLACMFFYTKKDAPDIGMWYVEHGLANGPNRPIRIYLACVYFIVATLATVGYGDIHATQQDERIAMICIMLLGTIVFALIISTASMIVQNSSMDDAAHGSKISKVHEFCHSWQLPENVKYQILDYFLASKVIKTLNPET